MAHNLFPSLVFFQSVMPLGGGVIVLDVLDWTNPHGSMGAIGSQSCVGFLHPNERTLRLVSGSPLGSCHTRQFTGNPFKVSPRGGMHSHFNVYIVCSLIVGHCLNKSDPCATKVVM